MIEVIYPNDDDPKKDIRESQPDPFMEIDALLEAKTMLGEELPTMTELASDFNISEHRLNEWMQEDTFKDGLKMLRDNLDANLESTHPWSNRADVMLVRLLLLETKNRHEPKEG